MVEEGKVRVTVPREVQENLQDFRYAINTYVMAQNHDSYDIEVEYHGVARQIFGGYVGKIKAIYITMPGSIPVDKNLPPERHFQKRKTSILAYALAGGLLIIVPTIIMSAAAGG